MFPILPSTGLQAQAHREEYAPGDEEAYAQKFGRIVRLPGLRERVPSRARFALLVAAVIITLAVVAFVV